MQKLTVAETSNVRLQSESSRLMNTNRSLEVELQSLNKKNEERDQLCEKSIIEHEISSKHLKDEISNIMQKLTVAETSDVRLQSESSRFMNTNRSLEVELQSLNRKNDGEGVIDPALEKNVQTKFKSRETDTDLRTERSALKEKLQNFEHKFSSEVQVHSTINLERISIDELKLKEVEETLDALTNGSNQLQAHSTKQIYRRILLKKFNSMNSDKIRLEHDLAAKNEELQELKDRLDNVMQRNLRLTLTLNDTKSTLLKVEEEIDEKDVQLTDSRKKEIELRIIIKKYKDSYAELKKKLPEAKAAATTTPGQAKKADYLPSQLEFHQPIQANRKRSPENVSLKQTMPKSNKIIAYKLRLKTKNSV